MAPKRKTKATSAVVAEADVPAAPAKVVKKRGAKASAEEVVAAPENGNGDVAKPEAAPKRSRRGVKDSNGNAAEESAPVSQPKASKRGKKEKPKDEPAEDVDEEVTVKQNAGGRKRGKAKEKEEVEETAEPKADAEEVAEEEEEEEEEAKPKKAGRGKAAAKPKKEPAKRAKKSPENESGEDIEKKPPRKREAKAADDKKEAKKPKIAKTPMNKTSTSFQDLSFSCKKASLLGKLSNFKIASWNVDGIRAWVNKGGNEYITYEKPDILCLQETRCPLDKLPEEVANVPGYHPYWLNSGKDGYAGVGIYTKQMAINVQYGIGDEEQDSESRIITAEYERFYLVCVYVPNAGRGLVTLPKRLKWNELFRCFVKKLDEKKPVIICGDMNVSHLDIDLTNPKTNKKNAGFTPEEREGMTKLLGDGFVDTYRHLYPDKTGAYTFWTHMSNCRAKNVGWRLDYFLVSERLVPSVCDNVIRNEVFGSDHCPITLFLHLNGVGKLEDE